MRLTIAAAVAILVMILVDGGKKDNVEEEESGSTFIESLKEFFSDEWDEYVDEEGGEEGEGGGEGEGGEEGEESTGGAYLASIGDFTVTEDEEGYVTKMEKSNGERYDFKYDPFRIEKVDTAGKVVTIYDDFMFDDNSNVTCMTERDVPEDGSGVEENKQEYEIAYNEEGRIDSVAWRKTYLSDQMRIAGTTNRSRFTYENGDLVSVEQDVEVEIWYIEDGESKTVVNKAATTTTVTKYGEENVNGQNILIGRLTVLPGELATIMAALRWMGEGSAHYATEYKLKEVMYRNDVKKIDKTIDYTCSIETDSVGLVTKVDNEEWGYTRR